MASRVFAAVRSAVVVVAFTFWACGGDDDSLGAAHHAGGSAGKTASGAGKAGLDPEGGQSGIGGTPSSGGRSDGGSTSHGGGSPSGGTLESPGGDGGDVSGAGGEAGNDAGRAGKSTSVGGGVGTGGSMTGAGGSLTGAGGSNSGAGGSTTGAGGSNSGAGGTTGGIAGSASGAGAEGGAGGSVGQIPCVKVAPDGDDAAALATNGAVPFVTVQTAVDFASTLPGPTHEVCIAQGNACGTSATYSGPPTEELRMRSGVNVRGDYESTTWSRCSSFGTTLAPQTARGVHFGSDIAVPTALDHVVIQRFPASPMTGVSVDGAHPVELDDVTIQGVASVDEAVGVDLQNGGEASIERLSIVVPDVSRPLGARRHYGVRAVESTVNMRDSTIDLTSDGVDGATLTTAVWLVNAPGSSAVQSTLRVSGDQGSGIVVHVEGGGAVRLDDDTIVSNFQWLDAVATPAVGVEAFDAGPVSLQRVVINARGLARTDGVRAARSPIAVSGTVQVNSLGEAHGVALETAPGSSVAAQIAGYASPVEGISISGDSHDVSVTGGSVSVGGGYGVAIALSDCAGASPSIAENSLIEANTYGEPTSADVIRSRGDCHPLIARNAAIVSDFQVPYAARSVIHCGVLDGVQSRCSIVDNQDIHVEPQQAFASLVSSITFTGIDCETGCAEITGNRISALSAALPYTYNLDIVGTGVKAGNTPIIARNSIWGGIGMHGSGLESGGGRIENNFIRGPTDGVSNVPTLRMAAGLVLTGNADVHSNTIFSGGSNRSPTDLPGGQGTFPCRADSVLVKNGHALFRNNALRQQYCVLGDPQTYPGTANYQHNFGVYGSNQYPGNSGNFYEDGPGGIDDTGHLMAGSPCIDAGTSAGVPATDIDGDARDSSPDIGADEWTGTPSPCRGVSCSDHGVCLVASGAGACQCDPGWAGADCSFVDACMSANGGCDPRSLCTPVAGGRICGPCPTGFTGDGETGCIDIDECAAGQDDCESPGTCINSPGGWYCACPPGYVNDTPQSCADTNECLTSNGDCDPLVTCVNTPGGRTCGACPSGYAGSGETGCVDVDECADNHGGCAPEQSCTNVVGSFVCGNNCDNVDCHGGKCVTDQSHFACVCPPGFTGFHCELATAQLVGSGSFCVRLSDGSVECWDSAPHSLSVPGTYTTISAGYGYVCGLDMDGHVRCSGSYGFDPLPTDTFVAIAAQFDHRCALRSDGSVACWGTNANGQATPPAGAFVALATGYEHSCGIRATGSIECWGSPDGYFEHGQTQPPAGAYKAIAATIAGTCAIRTDGAIVCWGEDFAGAPPPAGSFTALALGSNHGCAIRDDGTLACWGNYIYGRTSPPAGRFTQVAATPYATCALREDGVVACFGIDEASGLRSVPNGRFDGFPDVCSVITCASGSCSTVRGLHCDCPSGSNHLSDDPFTCVPNPCFDGTNGGCPDGAGCAPSDAGAVCFP